VHLVVVDPGVGSARRGLAVRAGGHLFVGPDNGVLVPAAEVLGGVQAARALTEPALWRTPTPSATFHGRDVFAPVAGALAAGAALERVGPPVADWVRKDAPAPTVDGAGRWTGRVAEIDRFGNLITDLPSGIAARGRWRVAVGGVEVRGPSPAYAAVARRDLVLVAGSEGTLEVAVRDGSAADRLGARVGDPVTCAPDAGPAESAT
jgi:S-adenosylmethionine hydrolase